MSVCEGGRANIYHEHTLQGLKGSICCGHGPPESSITLLGTGGQERGGEKILDIVLFHSLASAHLHLLTGHLAALFIQSEVQ